MCLGSLKGILRAAGRGGKGVRVISRDSGKGDGFASYDMGC